MKKLSILLGMLLFLSFHLSAQKQSYTFRTSPVGGKLQSEIGKDYRFVGFVIQGIRNDIQKKTLQKALSSNPLFKRVSINSVNEFHGFIHNSLDAHKVRTILLAQGVDFKFDRFKFKGCYLNEELSQKHKK